MAKQCRNCRLLDTDYEWDGEDEYEYCICSLKCNSLAFVGDEKADCTHAKEYKDVRRRSRACDVWEYLYGNEE